MSKSFFAAEMPLVLPQCCRYRNSEHAHRLWISKETIYMRMSKHAAWVLPLMLFSGAVVHAQCRIGSGPNHGDGIPWCSQPQQPAKRLPPVQWAEQWGAIAYGGGAFGEAKEMATVNDAQNAALNACQDSGGATIAG